jgi:hypothetical protein
MDNEIITFVELQILRLLDMKNVKSSTTNIQIIIKGN